MQPEILMSECLRTTGNKVGNMMDWLKDKYSNDPDEIRKRKFLPDFANESIKNKENFIPKIDELTIDNNKFTILKDRIILNFGYFYRGYSKNCFYWEIVLFSRKFLLIFVGVFTEVFPKNSKAAVFLVIINSYHYVQFSNKPFKHEYLNRLEKFSLFVCSLTEIIGILLISEKS